MKMPRYLLSMLTVSAAALCPASLLAQGAANYPWKPITMTMPFTPGSASDHEARMYQENIPEVFKGATFIIDYKPGGSGIIANSFIARQPPDGHNIVYAPATISILPAVRNDIPYDYLKDLTPVTLTTRRVVVVIVNPSFPASNLREYIAHARANPGKVTWATAGMGGATHLAGEWLANAAGIKLNFIHYKGLAAAEVDLIAGRIDSEPVALAAVQPQMKAGKVRAIAIISSARSPQLPDLKTAEEEGPAFAGYGYPSWVGIFTTGGTPRDIVDKLQQGFSKAIRTPKAAKVMDSQGSVPVGLTSDEFRTLLIYEEGVWRKLVKEHNIKAE